ncbi:MAG: DUF2391 family protein [Gemmatimonadetes bacterium]|nr:DUF2391 family protein [Gemmatimonadota bacterium]
MRAFAGALFGALPLLFTQEMWSLGRSVPEGPLLLLLGVAAMLVILSLLFAGFRPGRRESLALDLPIALGAGVLVSAATLVLVGQIQPGRVPLPVAVRMVSVEAMPCAIAAALALTLLRPRKPFEGVDRRIDALPQDLQKLLATTVGAVFFAFNVAPTEEPWKLTIEAEPVHFPLLLLLSLAATYAIVFLADFADRPPHYRQGVLGNPLNETLVSYLVSLAISWLFLVAFGYLSLSMPLYFHAAGAVMLGYATALGGAAGRVLVAQ